jgi:regulator of protease activity HflC (stomatin/prohibitin superfamily)
MKYLFGKVVVSALGVIFVIGLLLQVSRFGLPFRTVQPNQTAIAISFGKIKGIRESGFRVELFTQYKKYPKVVLIHSTSQAAATKDLQDIAVETTITFRIKEGEILNIYKNIGSVDDLLAKVLDPNTAQILKGNITAYSGEEVIQKRQELANIIKDKLSKSIDGYGIDILDVSLTNFTFTNPDFNAAIDRKQIAEQETLEAQFQLEKTKIEAEQQRVQKETLTPEILQKIYLEKWNGVLPTTLYVTDAQSNFLLPAK